MAAVAHTVRGWWRYSQLNPYRLGSTGLIGALLWLDVLVSHRRRVAVLCAAFVTVVLVTYLGIGASRAERARRYGCW